MTLSTKQKDIFSIFCGLCASFSLRFLGTFYFIEIIAFLSLFLIPWQHCFKNNQINTLKRLLLVWLIGAIISDIFNGTALIDSLKGWFNIIFILLLIPFAYWLLHDNPKRFLWYSCGEAISNILSFYLIRSKEMDEVAYEIWELYAWASLVIAIAGLLYYKGWHKQAFIYLFIMAIYFLYNGSRNLFLISMLTISTMLVIEKLKTNNILILINRYQRKIVILLFSIICCGLVANSAYEKMASSGLLGEKAYEKYVKQKIESGGNVLKGARTEVFDGLEFISRNPIIGYGSFAMVGNINLWYNYNISDLVVKHDPDKLIPTHSHLVCFWLWHGILAVIFWLYLLYIFWNSFRKGTFLYEYKLSLFCLFMIILQVWNIIFSPLAFRMPIILIIVYIIILNERVIYYEK